MRRKVQFAIFLPIILFALAWPTAVLPGSGQKDMKVMMDSNFGILTKILVNLIRSDYDSIPADVSIIEKHAMDLPVAIPAAAKSNQSQFLLLAYNLQSHAGNLKSVAKILREHDQKKKIGVLDIDYLRNTAAAHFGEMVTTCVACHNQFRRTILK